MSNPVTNWLAHTWNTFVNKDKGLTVRNAGYAHSARPDRARVRKGYDKTIISAIYNRISIDVAGMIIRHVQLDENGRYSEDMDSGLNYCLTVEANLDQTARAFRHDIVMSLLSEGCIAIVPTETSIDIWSHNTFDIKQMRVGKVTTWYPEYVKVDIYNDKTGLHEEKMYPKRAVAIIENPLYAVMNEPNSTLQRLLSKLNLLDEVDQESSSGKLNMIIQLPYVIKTEARKEQAQKRRQDIQEQLANSKYGIAYTDGTEKITQIGRPLENNLMEHIKYLTDLLYSQLGITKEVFDGTASEQIMLNYTNRTLEPILSAIIDEINRKFLTKTARTRGQAVMFFRDPFKLVPMYNMAQLADTFTRNEILSSNEIRQILGMKPSSNPMADELGNKNMPYDMRGPSEEASPDNEYDEYSEEQPQQYEQ